jgi:thioredoxin-related protein
METGTFPDKKLQEYIDNHFVPVKYRSGPDAEQFYRFGVSAEPAFIIVDAEGNEVYRKIGFFEADLLIEQLEKAKKKAARRAQKHLM